jgi:hypothetical protein
MTFPKELRDHEAPNPIVQNTNGVHNTRIGKNLV